MDATEQEQGGPGFAIVPVTRARQNCTIVWCRRTKQGAVIDPGGELGRIRAVAAENGVTIGQILITHGHHDHAGSAADLADDLEIPIIGPHREDLFWLNRLGDRDGDFIDGHDVRSFRPDRWLDDGDRISIGDQVLEAVHCPGHTPGHIVYFSRAGRLAFVGDVLFKGLIGTTELPRGDHLALLRSILGKLWPLGDDVRFVPGHGPMSTFGEERRSNACVSDAKMAPYRAMVMSAAILPER